MTARGRPKKKSPRSRVIRARVSLKEWNRIKWDAARYSSGDLSVWIRARVLGPAWKG